MRLFGSCSVPVSVLCGCHDPDTSVTFVWLISLEPDIFFCSVLVLLMFGSINGIPAEVRPDSASDIFVREVFNLVASKFGIQA